MSRQSVLIELSEVGGDSEAAGLAAALDHVEGLISEEDAEAFTSQLEPGSSAAILAFEHSWMKPIRDAVVESGGDAEFGATRAKLLG